MTKTLKAAFILTQCVTIGVAIALVVIGALNILAGLPLFAGPH